MSCNSVKKAASERLDWTFDYSDWLIEGDTIASAEASIDPELLAEPIVDGSSVAVWLSGGESGASYKVTVKVKTAQNRIKNEIIRVRVK